jgi:LPPG:FO 2-phospho-L-lactate transferase
LLRGLSSLLDADRLTVIVNTGDDEHFFGLHVSPDVDTVIYTLAGAVDPHQGWGVANDTFRCLSGLGRFYADTWFRLGDTDLATHLFRTDALHRGRPLSAVTADIARAHGVRVTVLPMSNDPVRTHVAVVGRGPLPFQRYLVERRGRGQVRRITWRGVRRARPAPGTLSALRQSTVVVIPPSNPFVSIGPILAIPGVKAALRQSRAQVAAVSPMVGNRPVKGPLHRMLRGLGHPVSALGVARLYRGLADVFVLDTADARLAPAIAAIGLRPVVTDTLMHDAAASRRLAATVLAALDT